jgi:hypothetical protein
MNKERRVGTAVIGVVLALLLFDVVGSLLVVFGPQVMYRTDDPAIVDLVKKTGATVEAVGGVSNTFQGIQILSFPARSFQLKLVNNQDAWLYEFSDPATANLQASLVSSDGSKMASYSGGQVLFDWIAPPHLYKSGILIVLYIGNDSSTLALLRSTIGAQFAGGW